MALSQQTKLVAALALVAAVVIAAFVYVQRPQKTKVVPTRLTIHFTCDTAGRLEPCGCFSGQRGGLTRLRTWMNGRDKDGPVLNLDVGGAIAGSADYDVIQYRYLAKAYASMDFAALNMGGREATLPASTLEELKKTSPVPMISASLVNAETRREILEPYRIITIGNQRIGILGVVSPHSVPQPGTGTTVLELSEAVDRNLQALAAKSDVVILLAFATEAEMHRLARDYFEFTAILGGDVGGPSQDLATENDSIILFTTNQGRTVGTLSGTLGGDKRVRLLEPSYSIDLLEEDIPQNIDLVKLVQSYRTEIRDTKLAIDDPHATSSDSIPGVVSTATYVGSESCRSCHAQAYATWEKSGHARAFQALVKKGADADPHCVACHTVGLGKESGYRRVMGQKALIDVGCESCHGPASEHLARYQQGKATQFRFRPLGAGDCKQCHYGEFSREFVWEKFWPAIKHGKETR